MFKRLGWGLLGRALVRELAGIRGALGEQNALLTRLVDRLAPAVEVPDPSLVRAETGLDHLEGADAALALAYIARTERDTGHTPDDDEVLIYLADEKTRDLQTRLAERDAEIASWLEGRR